MDRLSQTVPSPKTAPFSTESYTMPSGSLIGSDELRFDAGRYSPRFMEAISILRESGMRLERLGDTCNIFIPPRFKRLYVEEEHGVPFLQGSHIAHFQPADLKYLSLSTPQLEQWIIRAGWLLVTCSGTIGRIAICPPERDGWAGSQHILRIIPDEKQCPRGYLAAFLASPFGQAQLTANTYGAVVDELTKKQADGILVPLPETAKDKAMVHSLNTSMIESSEKRSEASALVSRSVEAVPAPLKDSLKLDRFSLRARQIGEELRIDAGHYNPALLHALDQLGKMGAVPLREIADVFMPTRFRRIYVEPEHGLPFLQGSHVIHFKAADLKYLSRKHKLIDQVKVETGWLLVTRSGTVGRVTVCPKEWNGWAASEHIIRVVPRDKACPAGYLCSFLASALGQVQLIANTHGAVVDELTEEHIGNVLVPRLDSPTVRKIDSFMQTGMSMKSEAVELAEASVKRLTTRFGTQSPRVSKEHSGHPEPKSSPTRDEHFEKIEATPEELARAFLRTPPKKPDEWDYMKGVHSDD